MINYFILQLTMINVLLILSFILLPQIKQNIISTFWSAHKMRAPEFNIGLWGWSRNEGKKLTSTWNTAVNILK